MGSSDPLKCCNGYLSTYVSYFQYFLKLNRNQAFTNNKAAEANWNGLFLFMSLGPSQFNAIFICSTAVSYHFCCYWFSCAQM